MRRHHLVTALLGFALSLGSLAACSSDEATTEADTATTADTGGVDVPVLDVPGPVDVIVDVPPVDIPPVDVPAPDLGPPPDPQICTGNVTGQLQQLGGACCYTTAQHPNNPN